MCRAKCLTLEKQIAVKLVEELRDRLSEITVGRVKRIHDELDGGDQDEVVITRGNERVELCIYLGDPECDVGPFDGKSWVLISPMPWWRNRWNMLPAEIERVIVELEGSPTPDRLKTNEDPR